VSVRLITLTIVGFILGAFAAGGIGVRVIREVSTAEDATSLPSENIAPVGAGALSYQVDPNETLIASTALVPSSVLNEDGAVTISYDLISLTPSMGVEPMVEFLGFSSVEAVPNEDLDHIYPRRWVIDTPGGPVEGGPGNESARSALFKGDRAMTIDDIGTVRIVEALAPFPFAVPVELSIGSPVVELLPGVSVELINVSDQGSTTIIQVAVDVADEAATNVFVAGDGAGWRSAVFEAEGRPRVNLTWAGGTLPADIPLVVSGTAWVNVGGPFAVSMDGVK
jgi:hypothetical protein